MEHFLIITNKTKDPDAGVTNYIRDYLTKRGKNCTKDLTAAECVLVLGGDGTLLRAAAELAHLKIPFLGINLGNLGFLAEVEQSGLANALERLINNDYEIESRMLLQGNIAGHETQLALNEAVILGKKSMQLMYFKLYVNGLLLNRYAADGMIVATPTGSTGYNLSAGGPIVEPKAEMLLLTPLCPHSLNSRSIILSARDRVTIEIDYDKYGNEQQAEAIFDGHRRIAMTTGDRIMIIRAEQTVKIVKLSVTNFLEILQRKMSD